MKRLMWGRLALIIGIFVLSTNATSALIGSSASYSLGVGDMTTAGNNSSSANYTGTETLGDNFDGVSSSSSYTLCSGFVEESLGGCVKATPPPPPPPPGDGGGIAGGRPPDYAWPPITQETEYIPPATQETEETEETIKPQPTIEIPVIQTQETQETQIIEATPELRPSAPEDRREENLYCETLECYLRGGAPLHGAALEKEIPWCFIMINLVNALITAYFIWEMVILYLLPKENKKRRQSKKAGVKKGRQRVAKKGIDKE